MDHKFEIILDIFHTRDVLITIQVHMGFSPSLVSQSEVDYSRIGFRKKDSKKEIFRSESA